jgi:hypothetical protein
MTFNAPGDVVYVAALSMMQLFERHWEMFGEPRSTLLDSEVGMARASAVVKTGRPGSLRIKLKKSRGAKILSPVAPPTIETISPSIEGLGVFRERTDSLVQFSEMLCTGATLRQATLATASQWRTVSPMLHYVFWYYRLTISPAVQFR